MIKEDIIKRGKEISDYLIKIRRDLHRTPELAMQEFVTKEKIKKYLDEIGIDYMEFEHHRGLMAYIYRKDGITLDKLPADKFVGKALVIDCSDLSEGDKIDISYINKYKDIINEAEFVLFKTNWDKYWDTDKYFGKFPVINDEVVDYLINSNKKGIGLDVISIEDIDSHDLPVHHKVLKNNLVIIENLCNLDQIGNDLFTLCALPLKFIDSDGASIRAVAILD